MLRQEEIAFINAISKLQLSPAFLRELRMTLSSPRKKRKWCLMGAEASRPTLGLKHRNVH